jgi:hypothetical protein
MEILAYPEYNLTSRQSAAIVVAGSVALHEMERRYGSGYPEYRPGEEATYALHGSAHGVQVGNDSELMAVRVGLSAPYVRLARATGRAHDAILTDGYGNKLERGEMEAQTAEFFAGLLRDGGVPGILADTGSLAVLGTRPWFDETGQVTGQAVTHMEFPDRPAELLALSVASADLAGTLSPVGPIIALSWYREDRGYEAGQQMPFDAEDLTQYTEAQVAFVSDHQFPHPAGEKLFAVLRGEVVAYHAGVLAELQAGSITSWAELAARAEAFREAHATYVTAA